MRLGKMKVLLTLHGFKFLLQRHQLQPEELGHLLVLLSLPSGQNVGFRKCKHNQGSCKLTSDSVIEISKSQFCSSEMKECEHSRQMVNMVPKRILTNSVS